MPTSLAPRSSRVRTRLAPALLVLALLVAACGGGPPILVVAPEAVAFGAIPALQPVSTTVAVRNTGGSELKIEGVRTTCGCTSATLSDDTIAAGSTADMTITFNPQAHPGVYDDFLRVVLLTTNDPTRPEVEVPVTVTVLEPGQ
jgi:hypothetical protein